MPSDVLKLVFAYCLSPLPGFQLYRNLSVISAEISSLVLVVSLGPSADFCKICLRPIACTAMVLTSVRLQWCSS